MANDDEREFRLRPRKPVVRRERRVLATAYKTIMHYARMSGVRKRRVFGRRRAESRSALPPALRGPRLLLQEHVEGGNGEHTGDTWFARAWRLTVDPGASGLMRRAKQPISRGGLKAGSAPTMNAFGRSSFRQNLATGPI